MAYNFCIDPEVNCVFVRHFGNIPPGEIDAQLAEMFDQDSYFSSMNILRDLLDASFSDEFGFGYFKERAPSDFAQNERKLGNCRVAWVLPSSDDFIKVHQMKLVRSFQASRIRRKEFFELPSAKIWLDIPEDYQISFPSTD